jgi:hypothetical protein
MMSSVYGGSLVNIAATGAVDGNGGCFFDRSSTWKCQVEAGAEKVLYTCVPDLMDVQFLSKMPLLRRGWTF